MSEKLHPVFREIGEQLKEIRLSKRLQQGDVKIKESSKAGIRAHTYRLEAGSLANLSQYEEYANFLGFRIKLSLRPLNDQQ